MLIRLKFFGRHTIQKGFKGYSDSGCNSSRRAAPGNNAAPLAQQQSQTGRETFRSHILFLVLEYLASTVHQCQQNLTIIDVRTKKLEQVMSSVRQIHDELKALREREQRNKFNLKDEGVEVSCMWHCFICIFNICVWYFYHRNQ